MNRIIRYSRAVEHTVCMRVFMSSRCSEKEGEQRRIEATNEYSEAGAVGCRIRIATRARAHRRRRRDLRRGHAAPRHPGTASRTGSKIARRIPSERNSNFKIHSIDADSATYVEPLNKKTLSCRSKDLNIPLFQLNIACSLNSNSKTRCLCAKNKMSY